MLNCAVPCRALSTPPFSRCRSIGSPTRRWRRAKTRGATHADFRFERLREPDHRRARSRAADVGRERARSASACASSARAPGDLPPGIDLTTDAAAGVAERAPSTSPRSLAPLNTEPVDAGRRARLHRHLRLELRDRSVRGAPRTRRSTFCSALNERALASKLDRSRDVVRDARPRAEVSSRRSPGRASRSSACA